MRRVGGPLADDLVARVDRELRRAASAEITSLRICRQIGWPREGHLFNRHYNTVLIFFLELGTGGTRASRAFIGKSNDPNESAASVQRSRDDDPDKHGRERGERKRTTAEVSKAD